MRIFFDEDFYKKYKKVNIRIQSSVDESIRIFRKNPMDKHLNNHALRKPYHGYKSINITADYRAFYKERYEGEEKVAYFEVLGTHDELYRKSPN